MTDKTCSRCKISFPSERFYKRRDRNGGLRSQCKACDDSYTYTYYEKHRDTINTHRREYLQENKERIYSGRKIYRQKNKDHINQLVRERREARRIDVLLKVGHGVLKCANCGCNELKCLQINHINGGGRKEIFKVKDAKRFYLNIMTGERSIDDLNLLCGICNWLDHMERKSGRKGSWCVTWLG